MYKQDLALNNLKGLIWHETQLTNQSNPYMGQKDLFENY